MAYECGVPIVHLDHLEGKPDNRILKGHENDHPSPGKMASFQQQITRIQASFHGHQQKISTWMSQEVSKRLVIKWVISPIYPKYK